MPLDFIALHSVGCSKELSMRWFFQELMGKKIYTISQYNDCEQSFIVHLYKGNFKGDALDGGNY